MMRLGLQHSAMAFSCFSFFFIVDGTLGGYTPSLLELTNLIYLLDSYG